MKTRSPKPIREHSRFVLRTCSESLRVFILKWQAVDSVNLFKRTSEVGASRSVHRGADLLFLYTDSYTDVTTPSEIPDITLGWAPLQFQAKFRACLVVEDQAVAFGSKLGVFLERAARVIPAGLLVAAVRP